MSSDPRRVLRCAQPLVRPRGVRGGLVLFGYAVSEVIREGTTMSGLELLAVPLIVVIAKFPMVLDSGDGGIEVGFDSSILMFLLCTLHAARGAARSGRSGCWSPSSPPTSGRWSSCSTSGSASSAAASPPWSLTWSAAPDGEVRRASCSPWPWRPRRTSPIDFVLSAVSVAIESNDPAPRAPAAARHACWRSPASCPSTCSATSAPSWSAHRAVVDPDPARDPAGHAARGHPRGDPRRRERPPAHGAVRRRRPRPDAVRHPSGRGRAHRRRPPAAADQADRGARHPARHPRDRRPAPRRPARPLDRGARPAPGPLHHHRRPAGPRGDGRGLLRRVRPAAADRGHDPPGPPRPAHRPAQPRPAARPGRARPADVAPAQHPHRAALRRPRRLQAGQRPVRPRRRRRGADRRRRPADRLRAAERHRGPARRRRVRAAARGRAPARGHRRPATGSSRRSPGASTSPATTLALGASIGVAYGDGSETAEGMLRNADLAMYEAKARGKNQYVEYERAIGRSRLQRLELVESLRASVAARRPHARLPARGRAPRPAGSPASRRWPAGSPTASTCRPTCSSGWPRRPVSSSRSARWCSSQAARDTAAICARRPAARSTSASTSPPSSCASPTSSPRSTRRWPRWAAPG